MSERQPLTSQAYAARLTRARTWHLYQAGAARNRVVIERLEVDRHEQEVVHLDEMLRAIANGGSDGGAA